MLEAQSLAAAQQKNTFATIGHRVEKPANLAGDFKASVVAVLRRPVDSTFLQEPSPAPPAQTPAPPPNAKKKSPLIWILIAAAGAGAVAALALGNGDSGDSPSSGSTGTPSSPPTVTVGTPTIGGPE